MAILATISLPEGAVLPLVVGNLLGKLAQGITVVIVGRREQRMAGCAELGLAEMVTPRGDKPGSRAHDSCMAIADIARSVKGAAGGHVHIDDIPAVETRMRAEILGLGLMTACTGHAVQCQRAHRCTTVRTVQVVENLAWFAIRPGLCSAHRHMTGRTRVLDFTTQLRAIQDFPPHGGLPVGVFGRVRHYAGSPGVANRYVGAIAVLQVAVAGNTGIGCHEQWVRVCRSERCEPNRGDNPQAEEVPTSHPRNLRRTSPREHTH